MTYKMAFRFSQSVYEDHWSEVNTYIAVGKLRNWYSNILLLRISLCSTDSTSYLCIRTIGL